MPHQHAMLREERSCAYSSSLCREGCCRKVAVFWHRLFTRVAGERPHGTCRRRVQISRLTRDRDVFFLRQQLDKLLCLGSH
jgi:hypothetical protein